MVYYLLLKEVENDYYKVNKGNFNYKKIRSNMWKLLDKYVPQFEEPP